MDITIKETKSEFPKRPSFVRRSWGVIGALTLLFSLAMLSMRLQRLETVQRWAFWPLISFAAVAITTAIAISASSERRRKEAEAARESQRVGSANQNAGYLKKRQEEQADIRKKEKRNEARRKRAEQAAEFKRVFGFPHTRLRKKCKEESKYEIFIRLLLFANNAYMQLNSRRKDARTIEKYCEASGRYLTAVEALEPYDKEFSKEMPHWKNLPQYIKDKGHSPKKLLQRFKNTIVELEELSGERVNGHVPKALITEKSRS
jgi:hypothetical protein